MIQTVSATGVPVANQSMWAPESIENMHRKYNNDTISLKKLQA